MEDLIAKVHRFLPLSFTINMRTRYFNEDLFDETFTKLFEYVQYSSVHSNVYQSTDYFIFIFIRSETTAY